MAETGSLSWGEASIEALKGAGQLTADQVLKIIKDRDLRPITGKTPAATVAAQLYTAAKDGDPRLKQVGKGLFEHTGLETRGARRAKGKPLAPKANTGMSFLDAAERVLEIEGNRQPMTVRDITHLAIEKGLIATGGLTPAATLSAQIGTDTRRRLSRGENPRFTNPRRGYYGLSIWEGEGIAKAASQHRREIASDLKKRMRALTPDEFETLVGQVLVALGVEDAVVVGKTSDKGVDVRGTLVVADVIRRKIVAQAKRWNSSNVGSPEVRNLRGSLGPHDLALLVTVGRFSPEAIEEAERSDATPVALLDGDGVVDIMLEHQIGVSSTTLEIFELSELDLNGDDIEE